MILLLIVSLFSNYILAKDCSVLDVYKIKGTKKGPVLLVIGGIHGDEPSSPFAVDRYKDLRLEKGTLMLVPRANPCALEKKKRFLNKDLNRLFAINPCKRCYETGIVKQLKDLIGTADMVISLHEGSGLHSKDPMKYGQSIVIDDASLKGTASYVVQGLNDLMGDKGLKFVVNYQDTGSKATKYPEQKGSLTYYTFYEAGVPSYGVEVSKDIQDVKKKATMLCQAIGLFAKKLGIRWVKTGDKVLPECNIN